MKRFYDADRFASEAMLVWRRKNAVQKANSVTELCSGLQVNSLIELGAGTGFILSELSSRGFAENLAALDLSPTCLHVTRSLEIPSLRASIVASVERLPFRDKAYDVALLSHIVEHLVDPVPCLAEASRIAKYVVIEVPLEGAIPWRVREWAHRVRRRIKSPGFQALTGHIQFYRCHSLKSHVRRAGMNVLGERLYIQTEDVLKFNPSRTEALMKMERRRLAIANRFGEQITGRFLRPWSTSLGAITNYAVLAAARREQPETVGASVRNRNPGFSMAP